MRCITLLQPFADRVLAGRRVRDHRTGGTAYRGPVAIHAGHSLNALDLMIRGDVLRGVSPIVFGALVGVVELVDCFPNPKDARRWVWVFASPRKLPVPIPMEGRRGLWEVEMSL